MTNKVTNKDEYYKQIYNEARPILEKRLSEFRFLHSISVSDTAAAMAEKYGLDVEQAKLAGLLHDWDKHFSDKELFKRLGEFGIEVPWRVEDMGFILHALTGAQAVKKQFAGIDEAIIQAISRHTAGAVGMSDLDILVYVSDMIEPLRSSKSLAPLRADVGKIPLETLFLRAYEVSMLHLIKRHRFIHPQSLEVWNFYVAKERALEETEGKETNERSLLIPNKNISDLKKYER